MGEQMKIEKMNQTQQLPWLVNNILFCYEGEKHIGNVKIIRGTVSHFQEQCVVCNISRFNRHYTT